MELNYSIDKLQPWGITPFDRHYSGLPKRTFNLLRSCNKETIISATGHFLQTGVDAGERVVLVGFDQPFFILDKYKEYGFSFDNELLSEKFIYLYYKSRFSYAMSFAENYQKLFEEASRLSKGEFSRIAFLNADVLFNLETHLLTETSAEKMMASFSHQDCVVLGSYQSAPIAAHQNLDAVSQRSLSSYIEIRRQSPDNNRRYNLILRKSPLFDADAQEPLELCLTPGSGFNSPNIELIKHG